MRAPLLFLLLLTGIAFADTGGSMGGGSWGGGGGGGGGYSGGGGSYSSGGGGGGWSSSSSSGGGWSSSSSSDYHTSEGPDLTGQQWLIMLAVMGIAFAIGLAIMAANKRRAPAYTYRGLVPYVAGVDVSILRVAVDGRARKFVQTELARIAKVADTKTEAGRSAMLREVATMLRKLRDAWIYGGAVNHPMRDIGGAKSEFDKAVDDARSRFREEVIRNADGTIKTKQASSYTPRSDEGAGVILVSIIVAARQELYNVQQIGNGDALRRALESASQLTPNNLVAIEIVWQPAEDSDRLSSMELEAKYPLPELIPILGALVGKTFCDYCTGPFPAELVSCPHCGAPAPGREAA